MLSRRTFSWFRTSRIVLSRRPAANFDRWAEDLVAHFEMMLDLGFTHKSLRQRNTLWSSAKWREKKKNVREIRDKIQNERTRTDGWHRKFQNVRAVLTNGPLEGWIRSLCTSVFLDTLLWPAELRENGDRSLGVLVFATPGGLVFDDFLFFDPFSAFWVRRASF